MAGSKKYMVYKADNNANYAVQIDESNGEVADFEDYSPLFQIGGTDLPLLPRGMTMRYANVTREGTSRKIWVGKPNSPIVLGSVVSILLSFFGVGSFAQSVAWAVSSIVSEKLAPRPRTDDTGILDGDAD